MKTAYVGQAFTVPFKSSQCSDVWIAAAFNVQVLMGGGKEVLADYIFTSTPTLTALTHIARAPKPLFPSPFVRGRARPIDAAVLRVCVLYQASLLRSWPEDATTRLPSCATSQGA